MNFTGIISVTLNLLFLVIQPSCADECGLATWQRMSLPDTSWSIEAQVESCGFGIGGMGRIVAINQENKNLEVLAQGQDIGRASISIQDKNIVLVKLPNLTDIKVFSSDNPVFRIIYEYYPYNNPEARKHYQSWDKDRSNPENRRWYCENVLSHVAEPDRTTLDKSLAYTLYKSHTSRTSYCNYDK